MERIERVRHKVKRAEKHIHDLEAAVRRFIKTEPYKVGTQRHPQFPQFWQYIVIDVADICTDIPLICGDVLQTLRAALDHLAYQLVLASGKSPDGSREFRAIAFPISRTSEEYEASKHRKVQLMSENAIKAIDAVKPYKGGNDTIWRLSELNNIDKHRTLTAVGAAVVAIDALRDWGRSVPLFARLAHAGYQFIPAEKKICPLKRGDVLFEDLELHENLKFTFEIAFGEPEVAEAEPILESLKGTFDLVSNIISDFEPLLRRG